MSTAFRAPAAWVIVANAPGGGLSEDLPAQSDEAFALSSAWGIMGLC
jgi:hypothetical protein